MIAGCLTITEPICKRAARPSMAIEPLPVDAIQIIIQLSHPTIRQVFRLINKYFYKHIKPFKVDFVEYGAMNGFLKYCAVGLNRGEDDSRVCELAAEYGQLETLKWARSQNCPWNEWTCLYAAEHNHLEILKWAMDNGAPSSSLLSTEAAEQGNLKVLQWLHECGYHRNPTVCTSAAEYGHLEVIKWARSQNYYWDEETCAAAAENGHLKVIQWAKTHGCPWDEHTCLQAAANSHLEILQWAHENDCPWNPSSIETYYCSEDIQDYVNSLW